MKLHNLLFEVPMTSKSKHILVNHLGEVNLEYHKKQLEDLVVRNGVHPSSIFFVKTMKIGRTMSKKVFLHLSNMSWKDNVMVFENQN